MFSKFNLPCEQDIFDNLLNSIEFEPIINGRVGTVIVDPNLIKGIPIVRTTTKYTKPAQQFKPIHHKLVQMIKNKSNIDNLELNNALVELYTRKYKKMRYHSDQALDLDPDSYVCIFSCYDNPINLRKLIIKDKETKITSEIIMDHCSVIIFDMEYNQKHLHKIVLDSNNGVDNNWLGFTFRLSKTFIQFNNDIPYFELNGKELKLANDVELQQFYILRGKENKSIEFEYPNLDYTISESDLININ